MEVGVDDVGACAELAVELSISRSVEGHEDVRHNTSSAIDCAALLQRLEAQRVGEVNAVGIGKLAPVVAVDDIVGVALGIAFLVRLLYAAARGRVVAGGGQANHGTVVELDGALHQTFAEGAAPYDGAAVVVLNGSGEDL